jgi:hypothetical protein
MSPFLLPAARSFPPRAEPHPQLRILAHLDRGTGAHPGRPRPHVLVERQGHSGDRNVEREILAERSLQLTRSML